MCERENVCMRERVREAVCCSVLQCVAVCSFVCVCVCVSERERERGGERERERERVCMCKSNEI